EDDFVFTLDPVLGDFMLQSRRLTHPAESRIYSANEAYSRHWHAPARRWLDACKEEGGRTARYIGTLAADFHRNLLKGGIFAYPADTLDPARPNGKLRLLYEAAPLAFLAEKAGGGATDGARPILEIVPTSLHQRTPLFIGNRGDVETVTRLHQAEGPASAGR
ncbi:MAG: class 1 fructose-bisphosphatase, partial [Acidobacteriota bacterium]